MGNTEPESTNLSDWLAYYQILIEDVRYGKSQQWRLCYYILLLLVALFALSRTLGQKTEVTIVLFIAAVLLGTAGTHFLLKFQKDLRRYRENIKSVRDKFPKDLQEIARYKPAEEDSTYYIDFLYLLIGVIWAGVIFLGWTIGFWGLLFCK
jgi:hypothetical protein